MKEAGLLNIVSRIRPWVLQDAEETEWVGRRTEKPRSVLTERFVMSLCTSIRQGWGRPGTLQDSIFWMDVE
jgi:hypothetical protein